MSKFPAASALSIHPGRSHDDDELDEFLETHCASSMYLRAEMRRSSERAHFAVGRRDSRIAAVAAQLPSAMVVLQAPVGAAQLTRVVLNSSGRRLAGFLGPLAQVAAARAGLGLDAVTFSKDTQEDLFVLALSNL